MVGVDVGGIEVGVSSTTGSFVGVAGLGVPGAEVGVLVGTV
jgi:hypothetical protein